jgi:hypothetical protein
LSGCALNYRGLNILPSSNLISYFGFFKNLAKQRLHFWRSAGITINSAGTESIHEITAVLVRKITGS